MDNPDFDEFLELEKIEETAIKGEIVEAPVTDRIPGKLPRGRPSKLTPKLSKKIELALKSGASDVKACQFARLARNTFYEWMRKGRADEELGIDSPEREFYLMVEESKAIPAIRAGAVVVKALPEDPRLALAFLEKRYPEDYGRKAIDIRNTHELNVAIEMSPEEEQKQALKAAFILELLEKAKLRLESGQPTTSTTLPTETSISNISDTIIKNESVE
jgi:hypothetical protein